MKMKYGSEEFWEAYEERAAIMEFDAGMTRQEAEKSAFADVSNLCEKEE